MKIEPRIRKLEDQAQKEAPTDMRLVVGFISPCPETLGRCDHVVAAEVKDKTIHRLAGETVDALAERATAAEKGTLILVGFPTSHDGLPVKAGAASV